MRFNPAGYVHAESWPPAGGTGRAGLLQGQRPRRRQHAAAAARRRHVPRADRRRVGLRRQHLHQRRLHQLARREVRQARQLDQVAGRARQRRRAREREPGPVQHAAQHRRSIARTTSTSPTAATAASRSSIATARSSALIVLNAPHDKSAASGARQSGIRTRPTRRSRGRICITQRADAVSLHVGPGAGTRLQAHAGRQDRRHARRVRATRLGQFNWIHGIACPSENTLYVADMNNWRVQKLLLRPPARATSSGVGDRR